MIKKYYFNRLLSILSLTILTLGIFVSLLLLPYKEASPEIQVWGLVLSFLLVLILTTGAYKLLKSQEVKIEVNDTVVPSSTITGPFLPHDSYVVVAFDKKTAMVDLRSPYGHVIKATLDELQGFMKIEKPLTMKDLQFTLAQKFNSPPHVFKLRSKKRDSKGSINREFTIGTYQVLVTTSPWDDKLLSISDLKPL